MHFDTLAKCHVGYTYMCLFGVLHFVSLVYMSVLCYYNAVCATTDVIFEVNVL